MGVDAALPHEDEAQKAAIQHRVQEKAEVFPPQKPIGHRLHPDLPLLPGRILGPGPVPGGGVGGGDEEEFGPLGVQPLHVALEKGVQADENPEPAALRLDQMGAKTAPF